MFTTCTPRSCSYAYVLLSWCSLCLVFLLRRGAYQAPPSWNKKCITPLKIVTILINIKVKQYSCFIDTIVIRVAATGWKTSFLETFTAEFLLKLRFFRSQLQRIKLHDAASIEGNAVEKSILSIHKSGPLKKNLESHHTWVLWGKALSFTTVRVRRWIGWILPFLWVVSFYPGFCGLVWSCPEFLDSLNLFLSSFSFWNLILCQMFWDCSLFFVLWREILTKLVLVTTVRHLCISTSSSPSSSEHCTCWPLPMAGFLHFARSHTILFHNY